MYHVHAILNDSIKIQIAAHEKVSVISAIHELLFTKCMRQRRKIVTFHRYTYFKRRSRNKFLSLRDVDSQYAFASIRTSK